MKKLVNALVLSVMMLGAGSAAKAQQKIAHINSENIFAVMPEATAARNTLQGLQKQRETEIGKLTTEYQAKLKTAQDKERTLSQANQEQVGKELQAMGLELQSLQKRIQETSQKAQQELGQKQVDLFNPIRTKVDAAIKTVAREQGIAYVFDTSDNGSNNLVFWDGGTDLTGAVRTKLGISANATPAK